MGLIWYLFSKYNQGSPKIHNHCQSGQGVEVALLTLYFAKVLIRSGVFQPFWNIKTGDLKTLQIWIQIFFDKKIWNFVYFFTCILPNHMAHNILKDFLKKSLFANMTAGFLLTCQKSLRREISLICHWNIDSLKQKLSFVYGMVPKYDQNII